MSMQTHKQSFLGMNKKGNIGGNATNFLYAVVGALVVLALLAAVTPLLFTFLGNFTDALTASDSTGIGSALAVVLPILLVVGLFVVGIGVIAFKMGGKKY